MRTKLWLMCVCMACGTGSAPGDTEADATSSSTSTATSEQGSTSDALSTTGGSGDPVASSSSTTDEPGSSDTTQGDGSSTGGSVGPEPGCPAELPAGWVLCEDFEDFGGWGNFWTNEGRMAVEKGPAFSGSTSLRISHVVGEYGSGMADLRFGQGPDDDIVARGDETFREVWVRFYVRTHEAWPPDRGISEGVEVMSVVGGNRSIAVDASIYSTTQAEARVLPWSCVHDSELLCSNGNGDWNNPDLRILAEVLGESPLYGDERAGQWQCHEMHVRLDDAGMANGVLELWVDGNLEVDIQGLEYVGSWDEAGLNTVRFASFWNDQTGLDHHVDDVIVATEPVGCAPR